MTGELSALARLIRSGRGAFATVVSGEGSVPREPGAWLAAIGGQLVTGTIGGGQAEAAVLAICAEVERAQAPRRATLELGGGEGAVGVCGGRFDVLVEPVLDTPGWQELAGALDRPPVVWRRVAGDARGHGWSVTAAADTREAPLLEVAPDGSIVQVLGRRSLLVVVGLGHVGRALCRIATAAGFEVWAADDRPETRAAPEVAACARVVIGPLEWLGGVVPPGAAVALVTRGVESDRRALLGLAGRPLSYLGMIGSRRRVEHVVSGLGEAGASPETLARLRAPIGLPIGADTPEEIAISILAEVVCDLRGVSRPGQAGPERARRE
jgi:xanthine dehydrogenase accessory factor